MSSEDESGKWVLGIFVASVATAAFFYPHQVSFAFKFVWDIIAQNAVALYQSFFKH